MIAKGNSNATPLASDSVDAVITDPPYGLSFMGKDWDRAVPTVDLWREVLRVMKPGAFAAVLCTPRQDCQARMIMNLEAAGFVTGFTSIMWTYATGFPKAANLSKLADKRAGAEREIVGVDGSAVARQNKQATNKTQCAKSAPELVGLITAPATPEAKALDGAYAGFQPKPAFEPVLIVMKPLSEKTYLDQALDNGHGCSWLDSARIPASAGVPFDVVGSLLTICERALGSVLPTTWCSRSYIDRGRRAFDADYTLDKELSRLVASVQSRLLLSSGGACGLSSTGSAQDSQGDCQFCLRLCDELSPLVSVPVADDSPSPRDVLAGICRALSEASHSQSRLCIARLSTHDDLLRIVGAVAYGDFSLAYSEYTSARPKGQPSGRFPANLICCDDVLNDGRVSKGATSNSHKSDGLVYGSYAPTDTTIGHADSGSYSRYFDLDRWFADRIASLPEEVRRVFPWLIVPKPSKREKNAGLNRPPVMVGDGRKKSIDNAFQRGQTERVNSHVSVKPVKLMSYLVTLFSRPGEVVLDPFAGSGTTAVAAELLARRFVGIELETEYTQIARDRETWARGQDGQPETTAAGRAPVAARQARHSDGGQQVLEGCDRRAADLRRGDAAGRPDCQRPQEPTRILQTSEETPMRAEDIKVGHFYRFMGSNAVYAITAEWPAVEPREVSYFVIGPDGQIGQVETRRTAEELATGCSCEALVRFDWVDQPKPVVGFMEGLLG